MKEIKLTQGEVALVDDEDFEWLSQHKWSLLKNHDRGLYAIRGGGILMHRAIMCPTTNVQVDHIDRNGLNNQRNNLRKCSQSENLQNQRRKIGFKGVHWDSHIGKYRSTVYFKCTRVFSQFFTSPIDAARAYNEAAIKYFGEFACINDLSEEGIKRGMQAYIEGDN